MLMIAFCYSANLNTLTYFLIFLNEQPSSIKFFLKLKQTTRFPFLASLSSGPMVRFLPHFIKNQHLQDCLQTVVVLSHFSIKKGLILTLLNRFSEYVLPMKTFIWKLKSSKGFSVIMVIPISFGIDELIRF